MENEPPGNKEKELRKKILSLEIFKEIDDKSLEYNDDSIKNFLHTLCPKHIKEIDGAITCQSIDKKERLKKIIENSIYNELSTFLQPNSKIETTSDVIDVDGYQILTSFNGNKHSVGREANNACFGYVPENDSYFFTDRKRKIRIRTCDDNNEKILIYYYDDGINVDEQTITDEELTKQAKECLIFLTSVSLVELKKYYQTFTSNITQEKVDELPSPDTIISAMRKAQDFVEQMRNKEKENKREEDEKNGNNDIKIIIEGKTEGIKNNTTNTDFDNNNSWKDWFKTTPPFSCCYSCCYSLCNSEDEKKSVN